MLLPFAGCIRARRFFLSGLRTKPSALITTPCVAVRLAKFSSGRIGLGALLRRRWPTLSGFGGAQAARPRKGRAAIESANAPTRSARPAEVTGQVCVRASEPLFRFAMRPPVTAGRFIALFLCAASRIDSLHLRLHLVPSHPGKMSAVFETPCGIEYPRVCREPP